MRKYAVFFFITVFCILVSGCGGGGGGGGTPSSASQTSVTAAASPYQEYLYEGNARITLSCSTSGNITSIEGKCSGTDNWQTISSGNSLECVYTATGSYMPSCRINEAITDTVDNPVEIQDFYQGENYKLSERTKDISRSDYLSLENINGTTYTFTTTDPSKVTLQADDYIIATKVEEGETGYIRKVTSVQIAGDTVTVETEDASIEDIFEEVDVSASVDLSTLSGGRIIDSAGRVANADNFSFTLNNDLVISSSGSVVTKFKPGTGIMFYPKVDYDLKISHFKIQKFKYAYTGTLIAAMDIDITATREFSVSGDIDIFPHYYTPPIAFVGPVPLSLKFSFPVGATIGGKNQGHFTAGFASSMSVTAGAEYVEGTGWSNISGINHNFVPHHPQYTEDFSVNAAVYVKPQVTLLIAYVAGPKLYFKPYARAEKGYSALYSSYWDLAVGVEVGLDFDVPIKILSAKLAGYSVVLINPQPWIIDSSEFKLEASADPMSGGLSGGQFNTTVTCDVSGKPPEDVHSIKGRCDTSSPWQTLNNTEEMQCAYTQAGSYTPGCKVNDGEENEISENTSVTVANCPDYMNLFVSAVTEGTTFVACDTGNFKFVITSGAWQGCPPEYLTEHPEWVWCGKWSTGFVFYKNRPIDFSGGDEAPEHPITANWDFYLVPERKPSKKLR